MKSYSQAGQDLFVISLFYQGYKGIFVDIGCGVPDKINNTLLLEENGWVGLSLDIADYKEQWKIRKTPFVQVDALMTEFDVLFKMFKLPQIIDYLSLDIEGEGNRYKALERVMKAGYDFKVMTIEHDSYGGYDATERQPQRRLLSKLGYSLQRPDVTFGGKPFEDWWINPKYIRHDDTRIKDVV